MNKSTQNLINETTPFKVIKIKDYTLSLYWTKKGSYGYQVVTTIFKMGKGVVSDSKTNGYGYDKTADALDRAFRFINLAPKSMLASMKKFCQDDLPFEYRVGGNFYKVLSKDVRTIDKKGAN